MYANAAKSGIYAKLTGDATLGALLASGTAVYANLAPQGASTPYVIFQRASSVPMPTLGRAAAWESQTYFVKAVTDEASDRVAGQIAERIDTLLNDATITPGAGTLMVLRRTQDIDYTQAADGHTYHHVGGVYQIGLQ